MDIAKNIQPLTAFRNNSAMFLAQLKESRRPMALAVNGMAAAVVQEAEAYQRLLDLAAEASAEEGIRQGLEELENGLARPAREVFDELRALYGIPR